MRKKTASRRAVSKKYWRLYYYLKSVKHAVFQHKSVPSHRELLAAAEQHFRLSLDAGSPARDRLEHILSHIPAGFAVETVARPKRCKLTALFQPAKHPRLGKADADFVQSNDFLTSYEWRTVRYAALKENNGACCLCGRGRMHGAVLNVDHIRPRRTHPHLALDVNNLQVLCDACNHGKGNWDSTDWR